MEIHLRRSSFDQREMTSEFPAGIPGGTVAELAVLYRSAAPSTAGICGAELAGRLSDTNDNAEVTVSAIIADMQVSA